MKQLKRIVMFVAVTVVTAICSIQAFAQRDSLVILLSSKSVQAVDIKGASYRKVVGPARFLHNDTYLLCDTAFWNIETRVIDAIGNVSLLQNQTVLKSDKLTYLIDEDLAQFRGILVQLEDQDHNILRTRYLDYNTADSVAVFQRGGAMRDKDGQIIESLEGTYDSKIKHFYFDKDVNMFSDTIFVKTNSLLYNSDTQHATFGTQTDMWNKENMLSSDAGWYDRANELFLFRKDVHLLTENQEAWSDSLYFYRESNNVDMLGNVQITDTTRSVHALAGKANYLDTLSQVSLSRDPVIVAESENNQGVVDTVYIGADKFVYYTKMMFQVDSCLCADAKLRIENFNIDPVGEYRKKAAEEAAKRAEEEARNDPNRRPNIPQKPSSPKDKENKTSNIANNDEEDSLVESLRDSSSSVSLRDSSSLVSLRDSSSLSGLLPVKDSLTKNELLSLTDSLALTDSLSKIDTLSVNDTIPVLDSTDVGFLLALHKVKLFRKDIQLVCDSLVYCDLDSLARLYKDPIIWQDNNRQYTADSVYVLIQNESLDRASLMSNSFIVIQEDSTHFDQIRGAEMMAYFDSEGGLRRFDALGGASALFYLEENDALATVNKKESKMLSANFKDGEIERIYYYDAAKSDGYPVVQLSKEESHLKGFNWRIELCPSHKDSVTTAVLRPTERSRYESKPQPKFTQTNIYFPGYIDNIHRQIAVRDSLKHVRAIENERKRKLAVLAADSLALVDSLAKLDSLAIADSLALTDSLAKIDLDSTQNVEPADSLSQDAQIDSTKIDNANGLDGQQNQTKKRNKKSKEERQKEKELKKKLSQQKKEARQKKREEKWAEADAKDLQKQMKKEEKKLQKQRIKKRKALEAAAEQAKKDREVFEYYKNKYLKKLDKE